MPAPAWLRFLTMPRMAAVSPVAGQARFRETSEGVDLEIELRRCTGETAYPLAILEASDCSSASLQAPKWGGSRSRGLPVLFCPGTGVAQAATGYMRRSDKEGAWTVSDGSVSDIVGRVLVVFGENEAAPVACAVVARAEDLQRLELPPDDRGPSLATRAAIGGVCLARQYPGSSARCPDDAALLRCEATHCDIGNCLQTCQAYGSCLDQQGAQCSFTSVCEPSAACATCQNKVQQCSLSFCAVHAWCPATPTPDGPCQRLANCCALQGRQDKFCQGVLAPLLSGLGGDAKCIASMMDLDVLPLLHVPCRYGPVQPPMDPGPNMGTMTFDAGTPLADQSECGRDGVCSGGKSGKQCLLTCRDQSDCRAGFVCSGGSQGSRSFPDNYCTARCYDDAHCGQGGVCLWTHASSDRRAELQPATERWLAIRWLMATTSTPWGGRDLAATTTLGSTPTARSCFMDESVVASELWRSHPSKPRSSWRRSTSGSRLTLSGCSAHV